MFIFFRKFWNLFLLGVLEQKDGGKLSSGHETKAPETKTEDSRTSNPKFQVNNAAEEVHESLKIEVPNSDVEIVVNIDEEAENEKPQGENHQGEDEIIEEEEEVGKKLSEKLPFLFSSKKFK